MVIPPELTTPLPTLRCRCAFPSFCGLASVLGRNRRLSKALSLTRAARTTGTISQQPDPADNDFSARSASPSFCAVLSALRPTRAVFLRIFSERARRRRETKVSQAHARLFLFFLRVFSPSSLYKGFPAFLAPPPRPSYSKGQAAKRRALRTLSLCKEPISSPFCLFLFSSAPARPALTRRCAVARRTAWGLTTVA